MTKRHLYFAFGSNLDTEQMRRRCPASRPQAAAVLPGFRLGFAGTSVSWGGGVATVVSDGGESVPGLLYNLSARDLARLDRCEGHPWHYVRRLIAVNVNKKETALAWTYVLAEEATAPSDDYHRVIAEGYEMIADVVTDAHRAQLARAAFRAPASATPFDSAESETVIPSYDYSAWLEETADPVAVELYDAGSFKPYRFADRVVEALQMDNREDDAEQFYIDALSMLEDDQSLEGIVDLAERYVSVWHTDADAWGIA